MQIQDKEATLPLMSALCVCVPSHSVTFDSVILLTAVHQAPLAMGLSRQEY